jgi:hypothetical protein
MDFGAEEARPVRKGSLWSPAAKGGPSSLGGMDSATPTAAAKVPTEHHSHSRAKKQQEGGSSAADVRLHPSEHARS